MGTDFGAGLAFNSLVNAFIGDALLNNFVIRLIGRIVSRLLASRAPTQAVMDEAVRSRDPAYLPWRIVHLVKAWCAIVARQRAPYTISKRLG